MIELFRILKPGGWAIVQVPIDKSRNITFEDPDITSPDDRERAFGQYDHVRLYGLDYRRKLANAGFSVTIDEYRERIASRRFGPIRPRPRRGYLRAE